MFHRDLRSFLDALARNGRLRRVGVAVDPRDEIACVARWVRECLPDDRQFALRFDEVKGHEHPVVVGLYSTLVQYGLALGDDAVAPSRLLERWASALERPVPPSMVDHAPVHEVVETGNAVDLGLLPIPVWTPGRDAGPYVPSASVITKDPESGVQNMAVYRVQVQGPRATGLFFGSDRQHGAIHLAKHARAGRSMDVAIVIGGPPVVQLAAPAKTAYGIDELDVAGGLADEPVEVVRGRTVDLLVPAAAEIVIEGTVDPARRGPEGPFGEALGYMNLAGAAPVVEVSALCRRADAIVHGYVQQLPPSEGHLVWEMGVLGSLWYYLRHKMGLAELTDLALVPGSAGLSALAVQVRLGCGAEPGVVDRVVQAITSVGFGQKLVVIVDEDVDVRDPETLMWAVTSRADPHRDVTIRPDVAGFQLDPSTFAALGGLLDDPPAPPYPSSLMIVDATLTCTAPDVALPTANAMAAARNRWAEYGLPPLAPRPRLDRLLRHHGAAGILFEVPR